MLSAIMSVRKMIELVLHHQVHYLAFLLLITTSVASLPLGVVPGSFESVSSSEMTSIDSSIAPVNTIYVWRPKRELRVTSRKMKTAPVPMPSYFPFIVDEMLPASITTRHPSIIAISGCPAYYIADTNGRCRQAYQYNYSSPPAPRGLYNAPSDILWTPQLRGFKRPESSRPGPSQQPGRLASLLRNAARRFDYALWQNQESSSNSGESLDSNDIDKLREKILSALKIKKPENKDNGNQNSDDDD